MRLTTSNHHPAINQKSQLYAGFLSPKILRIALVSFLDGHGSIISALVDSNRYAMTPLSPRRLQNLHATLLKAQEKGINHTISKRAFQHHKAVVTLFVLITPSIGYSVITKEQITL